MCVRVVRVCPGCRVPTNERELAVCDREPDRREPRDCPATTELTLPLRREHFADWDCSTPDCCFNNDYLRSLEREFVVARIVQKGGDLEALDPRLTAEELMMISDDYGLDESPIRMRVASADFWPSNEPESSDGDDSDDNNDGDNNDGDNNDGDNNDGDNNDGDNDNAGQGAASSASVPLRRVRAMGDVDLGTLPNNVQQRIRALQDAIARQRRPVREFTRGAIGHSGAPLRRWERWSREEDELLLLLRDNKVGYKQIDEYWTWRHMNPLQKRVSKLQREREARLRAGGRSGY